MFSAIVTAASVEGLAVGKRYTAPILKIAAIMTKHRKVNIMAKSILPSFLLNSRYRSYNGKEYQRNNGNEKQVKKNISDRLKIVYNIWKKIPIMLPTVIPIRRRIILE
jgi:hypothetical protein